jgi:hypothetical protein
VTGSRARKKELATMKEALRSSGCRFAGAFVMSSGRSLELMMGTTMVA